MNPASEITYPFVLKIVLDAFVRALRCTRADLPIFSTRIRSRVHGKRFARREQRAPVATSKRAHSAIQSVQAGTSVTVSFGSIGDRCPAT
jgi:hypothetical protein